MSRGLLGSSVIGQAGAPSTGGSPHFVASKISFVGQDLFGGGEGGMIKSAVKNISLITE